MERLTKGNATMALAKHGDFWLEPYELAIERNNTSTIAQLIRRLAAYEDTGLEPEEIHNMREELEGCKEWMSFSMNDIRQKFFDFVRVMRQEAELDKKPKRRGG